MKASAPPALATWLLSHLVSGTRRESMIGDLVEQHAKGRSAAWFWRQTIQAIVTGFSLQAWHNKTLALAAVALGASFEQIYMRIVPSRLSWELDIWYRGVINWLLVMEWDGTRHVVYRLLGGLTLKIMYCALLAAVVWIAARCQPRERGLVATLFLATQLAWSVYYTSKNWGFGAGDPMSWINLLSYLMFAFVGIPASILLAAGAFTSRSPDPAPATFRQGS